MPNAAFEKGLFERKLQELGLTGDFSRRVLQGLADSFTPEELRASIQVAVKHDQVRDQETEAMARKILMLAQSNSTVDLKDTTRQIAHCSQKRMKIQVAILSE